MRFLKSIILLGCFFITFSGCQEEKTAEYEVERDNLIGDWSIDSEYTETLDGEEIRNYILLQRIEISGDGTAILQGFFTDTVDWYYQPEPRTILLLENSFGSSINLYTASTFDVELNSTDRHIWNSEVTFVDSLDNTILANTRWTLIRR